MSTPYDGLPDSAFWRPAVAQRHFSQLGPIWSPKFEIRPEHRVATYGSCFAQHIGNALRRRGFGWLSTERPPPKFSALDARKFNYNIFTSRVGNIYTTSLLHQWTRWALLGEKPPAEIWRRDERYFDPFRPAIEPGGFASAEELLALRAITIKAFGDSIKTADFFVFTLGLTECWRNNEYGFEYPACPGTIAGEFDPEKHDFHNLTVAETVANLVSSINLMKAANSKLKVLLTVSPVPLTATYSGNHVMVATTESKAVLRAAAGEISRATDYVDYFPSYELISNPAMRGVFFAPNQREVTQMGVDFVMDQFFSCLNPAATRPNPKALRPPPHVRARRPPPRRAELATDVVCEEELLDAFAVN
jgi:hypothetical protein